VGRGLTYFVKLLTRPYSPLNMSPGLGSIQPKSHSLALTYSSRLSLTLLPKIAATGRLWLSKGVKETYLVRALSLHQLDQFLYLNP